MRLAAGAEAGGVGDGDAVAGELGELGVLLGHERRDVAVAFLEALVAGVDVGAGRVEHGARRVLVAGGHGLVGLVEAVRDVVVRVHAVPEHRLRQRRRPRVRGERPAAFFAAAALARTAPIASRSTAVASSFAAAPPPAAAPPSSGTPPGSPSSRTAPSRGRRRGRKDRLRLRRRRRRRRGRQLLRRRR